MDLNTYVFGVRFFYWLYLFLTLVFAAGVVAYFEREKLLKKFYALRSPEKLIQINMFYPGHLMRHFFRLIPADGSFNLEGGVYDFTQDAIYKNADYYAYIDSNKKPKVKIEGFEYELAKENMYKKRWEKWPQIFYIFKKPFPLTMAASVSDKPELEFDTRDWDRFKKSTILTQIYAAMAGDKLMPVVVVLLLFVLIGIGVVIANSAGVIHLSGVAGNMTVAHP